MNRRLAEYALDRTTAEAAGALAGGPASTDHADSFGSRLSLFDDAGVGTADALAAKFEGAALADWIATATLDAYRHYRDLHTGYVDDWVYTGGELRDAVATDALDVYESPDFETVAVEPAADIGTTFGTTTEALCRPDPGTVPVLARSDGGNYPRPSAKSASSLANSEPSL